MIIFDLATAQILMAASLGAVCAAACGVLYRQQRRLVVRCAATDASLAALQRELQLTAAVVAKLGARTQPDEMRGTSQFDMAIDFARRGGEAAQLVQRFGMSRGEAELTVRMHGAKRSA